MAQIFIGTSDGHPCVCANDCGTEVVLPALWLRQHSPEDTQCDSVTGQRLFDPHLLPIDLQLTADRKSVV